MESCLIWDADSMQLQSMFVVVAWQIIRTKRIQKTGFDACIDLQVMNGPSPSPGRWSSKQEAPWADGASRGHQG